MKGDKKDHQILIRVSAEEKADFERAGEISGLGLSAWMRQKLRNAALKELQESGERVHFLKPKPEKGT